MKYTYTIYCITSTYLFKSYIGITKRTVEQRYSEHLRDSKKYPYRKNGFYKVLSSYPEQFKVTVLETIECTKYEAERQEQKWIDELREQGVELWNSKQSNQERNRQYIKAKKSNPPTELSFEDIFKCI